MNKKNIFFKTLLAGLVIIIYLLFASLNGINPESTSLNIQIVAKTFFPEGWGFFTRNPQEPLLDIYKVENNNKLIKILKPNGDYCMGACRESRIITFQLGNFLQQNKDLVWRQGKGNFVDSVYNLQYQEVVSSDEFSLLSKGKFILVQTEKLPWLWATKPLHTKINFKIIGFKII